MIGRIAATSCALMALAVARLASADMPGWGPMDCSVPVQSAGGDVCEGCPATFITNEAGPGELPATLITEPICRESMQARGMTLRCEARYVSGYEDLFCTGGKKPLLPRQVYEDRARASEQWWLAGAALALLGAGVAVAILLRGARNGAR